LICKITVDKIKLCLKIIANNDYVHDIIIVLKQILASTDKIYARIHELKLNTLAISCNSKDMDLEQVTSFNGKQPDELNINEAIIFNMKLNKYPICNVGNNEKNSKCPYNYLKNKPLHGYNKMSVSSLYSCHDENNLCWDCGLVNMNYSNII
jgi:hypothetical protein